MKLLITAGATREPLDAVRFLTNVSTGRTGALLAAELATRGHEVTLLRGEGAVAAPSGMDTATFTSTDDLLELLRQRLGGGTYDAVIMSAAVSDYRPVQAVAGKIDSAAPTLTLDLVRNPKLLPQLRGLSPQPLRVVGFKLTVGADGAARHAAVAAQFAHGGVDAVVQNDLTEIRTTPVHPFRLFTAPAVTPQEIAGVPALAAALEAWWQKSSR